MAPGTGVGVPPEAGTVQSAVVARMLAESAASVVMRVNSSREPSGDQAGATSIAYVVPAAGGGVVTRRKPEPFRSTTAMPSSNCEAPRSVEKAIRLPSGDSSGSS